MKISRKSRTRINVGLAAVVIIGGAISVIYDWGMFLPALLLLLGVFAFFQISQITVEAEIIDGNLHGYRYFSKSVVPVQSITSLETDTETGIVTLTTEDGDSIELYESQSETGKLIEDLLVLRPDIKKISP